MDDEFERKATFLVLKKHTFNFVVFLKNNQESRKNPDAFSLVLLYCAVFICGFLFFFVFRCFDNCKS